MADSNNTIYFLKYVSNFWINMYRNDALKIEASLKATADIIKSLYFSFLQRSLPDTISTMPIFQEQFWNVVEFFLDETGTFDLDLNPTTDPDKIYFIGYILDEPYSNIPLLYNRIYDPSIIYKSGTRNELTSRITEVGLDNALIVDQDYINLYNGNIIVGDEIIKPNETFIAKSDSYLLDDELSTGFILKNKDYFIELKQSGTGNDSLELNIESRIYFRKDQNPFLNNKIAQKVLPDGSIALALFAPKVFLDYQELNKMYGSIVNVASTSSIDYKNFIAGIIDLYRKGPLTTALNVAINVSNGYPVANEDENIISIQIEEDYFLLKSDRNNTYKIKRTIITEAYIQDGQLIKEKKAYPRLLISNPNYYKNQPSFNPINGAIMPFRDFSDLDNFTIGATYDLFWSVKSQDGFIDQLKVVDFKSQDKWWLEKTINSKRFLDQLTDISDENKSRLSVVDYVFEKILKHNTFGVFVDSRIMSNFQGISDFIKTINDAKPTWKTFLVNEQDLNVFSEMEFRDEVNVSVDSFIQLRTPHYTPPKIGMGMYGANLNNLYEIFPVKFGAKFEEWGSAYDLLQTTIELREGYIQSFFNTQTNELPVVGDNRSSFGGSQYGLVFEQVSLTVINSESASYVAQYIFDNDQSNILDDIQPSSNDAYIETQLFDQDNTLIQLTFDDDENSNLLNDLSLNNNDAENIELPSINNNLIILSFEDDTGITLLDSSGNSNNATIFDI